MITSLTLGNKSFPTNLIQGPLAGISSSPFRTLTWQYSQPAFLCTEMISAKTLNYQNAASHVRFVNKDPKEGPVCFQLSANDPLELAEAVKRVTDYGADLIDLNCGCPVKKIRNKGAGSKLLSDGSKLYQLISAMKNNTHVPISIKIRVDGGSQERFNEIISSVISDSGLDFLVVHGRHWTEHYETTCNYDEIKYFVKSLKIPVIGNGDIGCLSSLKKMFQTGCQGVMISRASVGQPWLIKQLIAEFEGQAYIKPPINEIGDIFIEHVSKLACLLQNEKFAVLQARRFLKYYARDLGQRSEYCQMANSCQTLQELYFITKSYFI